MEVVSKQQVLDMIDVELNKFHSQSTKDFLVKMKTKVITLTPLGNVPTINTDIEYGLEFEVFKQQFKRK